MARLHSCLSLMALGAAVLVLGAPEAQAGFSWRSGNDTPPQQSDDYAPPPPVQAQPATPPYATPAISLPPPASMIPSSPEMDRIVTGFGNDMPLALALRDVVPPQYAYSFGRGVNPGMRVSWQGGQPWSMVVEQMIAPLALTSRVYGSTVVIEAAPMNSAVSAVTPVTAPQLSPEPLPLPPPAVPADETAANPPVTITPAEPNAGRLHRRIISDPGPDSPRRSY